MRADDDVTELLGETVPGGIGPDHPHVVVLFGATGDLARRNRYPGC